MDNNQTMEREASVLTPNYAALAGDFGDGSSQPVVEEKPETTTDDKDPNEIKPEGEAKTEEKPEGEVKEEAKTEDKNPEVDVKKEGEEEKIEIELKPEDIEGYKPKAEDGTWKAAGELVGVEVTEESEEGFKAAIEAKYKPLIEEAKKYSLEQEYAKLKPETVTALKLIEMGVPEEMAFNPTAEHEQLLKLDDASLVRKDLEGLDGWDEERVNLEMEALSENPARLKHEALKLREFLKRNANEILATREAKLQEYTQNREKAAIQQKEQHLGQVKEALMAQESFLNAKIHPDSKSEIFQKYSRGDYGDIFKDGKSVAEYLLFKAYGPKILEETRKSSYAKGYEEQAKKLHNIPIKPGEVSKVVKEKIASNNQGNEGIKALSGDFGETN